MTRTDIHWIATLAGLLLAAMLAHAAEAPAPGTYPDAERYRETVQAFLAEEAAAPVPAGAIVAVGSSSMRMWHRTIHEDLAPLTVVARGFGGSNMNDLLHFVDDLVIRNQPRAVMIYEGDNDASLGIAPAEVERLYAQIEEKIHAALPEARIYLLSVKPSISRWSLWPQMQEMNHRLSARCASDARCTFIDVGTGMLNGEGVPRPEIFLDDNLHMNDAGYRIWTAAVRPVLLAGEARFEAPAAR